MQTWRWRRFGMISTRKLWPQTSCLDTCTLRPESGKTVRGLRIVHGIEHTVQGSQCFSAACGSLSRISYFRCQNHNLFKSLLTELIRICQSTFSGSELALVYIMLMWNTLLWLHYMSLLLYNCDTCIGPCNSAGIDMPLFIWLVALGLFSSTMRELTSVGHDGPKWIVLDGDIDPMWIESLNTVMDDNKVRVHLLLYFFNSYNAECCPSCKDLIGFHPHPESPGLTMLTLFVVSAVHFAALYVWPNA